MFSGQWRQGKVKANSVQGFPKTRSTCTLRPTNDPDNIVDVLLQGKKGMACGDNRTQVLGNGLKGVRKNNKNGQVNINALPPMHPTHLRINPEEKIN